MSSARVGVGCGLRRAVRPNRRHGLRQGVTIAATLLAAELASGCLSATDQRAINAYLLCDDCTGEEAARVQEIGWRSIPRLEGALIGPPPQRVGHTADKLRASFRRLAGVVTVPESVYVADYVENYVASYQRRAARALREVGQSGSLFCLLRLRECRFQATKALREAIARDSAARVAGGPGYYRGDVLRAIGASLIALRTPYEVRGAATTEP